MTHNTMNSNLLVSIIIPCYNDEQYIEQCVNSALNQTYSNIEVIVVDDGSNRKTKTVLKKLEPNITTLITQNNQGQSTARNVGIRYAKGNYILVLDSDDYFEPTFCEKAISIFLSNDSVKIVTCCANLIYEDGTSTVFEPKGGTIANFLYANDALGTSMFKKTDWSSSGGYDEEMRLGLEDWEFFIRVLMDGGTAAVLQEPLYNYRLRNDSTTSKANKVKYDLLKYIYMKHAAVFKDNFEVFITHLLNKLEREEREKVKNTERLDFKIGHTVLKPIRWIKSLIK